MYRHLGRTFYAHPLASWDIQLLLHFTVIIIYIILFLHVDTVRDICVDSKAVNTTWHWNGWLLLRAVESSIGFLFIYGLDSWQLLSSGIKEFSQRYQANYDRETLMISDHLDLPLDDYTWRQIDTFLDMSMHDHVKIMIQSKSKNDDNDNVVKKYQ